MAPQGVQGGNITIKVLCDVMSDPSLGDPYARYAAVARLLMDTFSLKCLDASFSNYLRDMTNTSWEGPAAGGGRCEGPFSLCWCYLKPYLAVLLEFIFLPSFKSHCDHLLMDFQSIFYQDFTVLAKIKKPVSFL